MIKQTSRKGGVAGDVRIDCIRLGKPEKRHFKPTVEGVLATPTVEGVLAKPTVKGVLAKPTV